MKKILITIFFFISTLCGAQSLQDSVIMKTRDLEIVELNNKMKLNFDYKMISKVDRDTIFYNKFEMILPLLKIKYFRTSNQIQTIFFENGQVICIDSGFNNKTKKASKWTFKKYKNKVTNRDSADFFDFFEAHYNLNYSNLNYIFELNWYLKYPENRFHINEFYIFTNGIATIVVINEGILSKYLRKNINTSFQFMN